MANRKPTVAERTFLLLFHATVSGGFLVAYLTGDEDTYGMHVFSGYAVLAALALRAVAGVAVAEGSPLRFPKPAVRPVLDWLARLLTGDAKARAERSPLIAWVAVPLLAGVGLAAISGAGADFVVKLEDLHEALGEAALWIVAMHVGLVLWLHWLMRLRPMTVPRWPSRRPDPSRRVNP
ncbi:hypothetical protein A6A40_23210 (plasmid) [Azospirillum humicireducens]|uniref:Cytochrome B n=1 Tax=Azospirillum humicireducens TaxID=1226968 RepID=A0A2R4VU63_9PROT|nr:hypothetical protein [Azospirillum humicireducens]AWB07954.1 hypothetical protein A6A40_23210 [Azospirillum humicireducens]